MLNKLRLTWNYYVDATCMYECMNEGVQGKCITNKATPTSMNAQYVWHMYGV